MPFIKHGNKENPNEQNDQNQIPPKSKEELAYALNNFIDEKTRDIELQRNQVICDNNLILIDKT